MLGIIVSSILLFLLVLAIILSKKFDKSWEISVRFNGHSSTGSVNYERSIVKAGRISKN